MILPIYTYGQSVLKKKAELIDQHYEGLQELISDMWDTMYNAKGVGLAAPQIGRSIRIFLIDTVQVLEEDEKEMGVKEVFINPQKLDEFGNPWSYEEGCLSIPHIRGNVERPEKIRIKYVNSDFEEKEQLFEGINARVIQHEYDHLEGVLFTELLKPVKRRLIKRKLEAIKKGRVEAEYRLKFAAIK
jgi:peptide deformylase